MPELQNDGMPANQQSSIPEIQHASKPANQQNTTATEKVTYRFHPEGKYAIEDIKTILSRKVGIKASYELIAEEAILIAYEDLLENQHASKLAKRLSRKPENQKTRKPENQKTRNPANQHAVNLALDSNIISHAIL